MKLTTRQKQIIDLLANQEDYVVIKDIANKLGVSERTVHYDIGEIERNNITQNFLITKKRGSGVKGKWISTPRLDNIQVISLDNEVFNAIFKRLVIQGETISINGLSNELFVSASSIDLEIKKIKDFIRSNSKVKLLQDNLGTRIVGKEEEIRNLITSYNDRFISQSYGISTIDKTISILSNLYPVELINLTYLIFNAFKENEIHFIAPYYEYNIFNFLLVLINRLSLGFKTEMFDSRLIGKDVYGINNYLIAKDMIELISEKLNIEVDESEILRLSIHLEGNRIEVKNEDFDLKESISSLTEKLIENMSVAVNEDLTHDEILKTNLNFHLKYMVFRLKEGVYIKNPILQDIMKDFRLTYDLVWLMTSFIEDITDLEITDDELGFITLHFQSALDRRKKSKMIYVISENAAISQQFTIDRLKSVLSPLDIIKTISLEDYEEIDDTKIDLLISTIPIHEGKIPVVYVSPLVKDEELLIIKDRYNKEMVGKSTLASNYLSQEHIYVDQSFKNKEEILDFLVDALIKNKHVKKEFKKSVFDRESKGNTDIIHGFAIPHGSYEFVNETTISILVNKSSVNWGNEIVNIIILYAISQ